MCVQLCKILHRLRDESGQSLIVVVSSMTVLLAMAGFGIDTASWMVKHHHDQVVADAAALAAAQCLAHPGQAGSNVTINGTPTTVPSCSSTSQPDTNDATIVAIDYAAANGLTITSSQVSFANNQVTVDASNGSKSFFAQLFGIDNTTQKASSVAGWNSKQQPCTTPGSTCDFMFANSSNCSSGSYVLVVSTQGSSAIDGDIQTNGSLNASEIGGGGGINGTGTFGPGTCTSAPPGNNKNPWNGTQPTQASTALNWPIDYSQDFPACYKQGDTPVSGESQCGSGGYPSYCTVSGTSITLTASSSTGGSTGVDAPQPGNIYCASGTQTATSGIPSEPSTWTGNVSITVNGSGGNNIFEDTFVGGTITYSGSANATISACGWSSSGYSSSGCAATGTPAPAPATKNYPIFYAVDQDPSTSCATATDSTSGSLCAFSMTGSGTLNLFGDFFVQNGTAFLDVHGNQSPSYTCIEANAIEATVAGNFQGDGPALVTGDGGPIQGGESLLQ